MQACCRLTVLLLLTGPGFLWGGHDEAWEILFDGTSTKHWRGYQQQDFPAAGWAVVENTLKTVVEAPRVDLVTREEYDDFELELEWKVSPGGNSGVFYNVGEEARGVPQTGPEIQILDNGGHRDGQDPRTSAGSLYALIGPSPHQLNPVGTFNKLRVIVRGDFVEHWLNGTKIVEYELMSPELQGLIAQSKFKDMPHFGRLEKGRIALQHHGQEVWFRNIRVRRLNRQHNQLAPAEVSSGWKLLFDGRTTQGWRGFRKEGFPAQGWRIENDSIYHSGGDGSMGKRGGDLITSQLYQDFELKFEWKIAPGSNSGLKYFISEARGAAIGHEYQIIDDNRHPDARSADDHSAGSLYDVLPPQGKLVFPPGEFNKSRIIVRGTSVEHWLNGVKVLSYELGSAQLREAIAHSKFKDVSGFGTKFKTPILLQDHGDAVWFRNIKIRELAPE